MKKQLIIILLCFLYSIHSYAQTDSLGKLADTSKMEEVVIVAATRNNQNIENSPLKVEVLGHEELSEEASIKPGNIASILGDVSGLQIQQSSATSGNSNVRVQGLDGRYTQIVRDGMPLYDGFSGGLGILTIPPLDLKQIELIKGSASTLYGGGAIGGLINLVSKRPTFKTEADVLVNYTTLKETNVNAYVAKRNKNIGFTFFTGYTNQQAVDVNNDGFSDVPNLSSIVVHPKLFFYPTEKTVVSIGYNGSFDTRTGGDMLALHSSTDTAHAYFDKNITKRHTAEYFAEHYIRKNKITLKGMYSYFDRNNTTNRYFIHGTQASYFNEVSVFMPFNHSDIVAGINVSGNDYTTVAPGSASLMAFNTNTLGAFVQYSYRIKQHTILEGGLRTDVYNNDWIMPLPRLAVFHRFNIHWASRAGFGMGYKAPNPLAQQTIEYTALDVLPLTGTILPELSYGYNAEVNYKKEWGDNSLFINQAFFLTQINNPIVYGPDAFGKIATGNAYKPIITKGFDTYIKLMLHGWELYAGYTFTDARNTYQPGNTFIPLTPKNRWAFVALKELGEKWRFGLEGSYTGYQYRYDYTTTPSYFFIAAMIQRTINEHFFVVLNCENLLDYRMSNVEPLYTGSVSNPMFKPLWAPIDGRVINLSVRWKLRH